MKRGPNETTSKGKPASRSSEEEKVGAMQSHQQSDVRHARRSGKRHRFSPSVARRRESKTTIPCLQMPCLRQVARHEPRQKALCDRRLAFAARGKPGFICFDMIMLVIEPVTCERSLHITRCDIFSLGTFTDDSHSGMSDFANR